MPGLSKNWSNFSQNINSDKLIIALLHTKRVRVEDKTLVILKASCPIDSHVLSTIIHLKLCSMVKFKNTLKKQ